MYGWHYFEVTESLNRYVDSELVSIINYDKEGEHYVLFSLCNEFGKLNDLDLVEVSKKEDGYGKLIILAEMFLSKVYKEKIGSFCIDKKSIESDKAGYFKL